MKTKLPLSEGLIHFPGYFDRAEQDVLVTAVRDVVAEAPLYVPVMPGTGKPMSVRMTNCGSLGWVTDKERGYRYQATHPVTGRPWLAIPQMLVDLWREVSDYDKDPEACLVNFYGDDARTGTRPILTLPLSPFPSATVASSASADWSARIEPVR